MSNEAKQPEKTDDDIIKFQASLKDARTLDERILEEKYDEVERLKSTLSAKEDEIKELKEAIKAIEAGGELFRSEWIQMMDRRDHWMTRAEKAESELAAKEQLVKELADKVEIYNIFLRTYRDELKSTNEVFDDSAFSGTGAEPTWKEVQRG